VLGVSIRVAGRPNIGVDLSLRVGDIAGGLGDGSPPESSRDRAMIGRPGNVDPQKQKMKLLCQH